MGLCSFSGSTNRLKDSMRMEKQRASRKTALIKAPRTSARAQPKVFLDHFLGDIWGKNRCQQSGPMDKNPYQRTLTET